MILLTALVQLPKPLPSPMMLKTGFMEAHDTIAGSAVRFQYDGKGRRIAKLVDDALGGSYVITHRYLHGASVDERLVHWQYDQSP